jgi:hypothetical protein
MHALSMDGGGFRGERFSPALPCLRGACGRVFQAVQQWGALSPVSREFLKRAKTLTAQARMPLWRARNLTPYRLSVSGLRALPSAWLPGASSLNYAPQKLALELLPNSSKIAADC